MRLIRILLLIALLTVEHAFAQNGLVKETSSEGKLQKAAHYSDGKLEGSYEEYFENGKLRLRGQYKNDKKHGLFQTWSWSTGKLTSEANYVNDRQHGLFRRWDENGKLAIEMTIHEGKEKFRGFFKKYEDGVLLEHSSWNQGEREGTYKEFWSDGKQKVSGSYRSGQEHGEFTFWNENGFLERKCRFAEGDKTGVELTYFSDGRVSEKANYAAGVLDGAFEKYDQKQQLVQSLSYKGGDLDGVSVEYMKNGKPRMTAGYKNGLRSGKTRVFYANGSLACEISFQQGELHGERKCNYRDGTQGVSELWDRGILKSAEYRDQNGKVIEKGDYFEDESLKTDFLNP